MRNYIITIAVSILSFALMSTDVKASDMSTTYTYDRQSNPQIVLELLDSPKKLKSYFVKDEKKKVVKKGDIKKDKKVAVDIADLEPGVYYIEINGYSEKIIVK